MQKRAMETRKKLIETGFAVIADKGYHNVTMDEIAGKAGLSTGIAYRYFKNKKELLLAIITHYFDNIQIFSRTEDERLREFQDIESMISYVLDRFYEIHCKYYGIHEELEGLRHTDLEVRELYHNIIKTAVEGLLQKCPENMRQVPQVKEKFYYGIAMLEAYAHMAMDPAYRELDIEYVKKMAVASVCGLFSE